MNLPPPRSTALGRHLQLSCLVRQQPPATGTAVGEAQHGLVINFVRARVNMKACVRKRTASPPAQVTTVDGHMASTFASARSTHIPRKPLTVRIGGRLVGDDVGDYHGRAWQAERHVGEELGALSPPHGLGWWGGG